MWYAPIGSFEYVTNLHNDFLIKKFVLSEQRLKQQNRLTMSHKTLLVSSLGDSDNNATKPDSTSNTGIQKQKVYAKIAVSESDKKKSSSGVGNSRLNRLKGCAVDVKLTRSFKKTHLDVVTYDSTIKSESVFVA